MDLFYLFHDVLHGSEALVYNNYPKEAAASTCLAIIFGRISNGFLRLTAVPMQLPHQGRRCNAVSLSVQTLMLAVVALNNRPASSVFQPWLRP